MKALVREYLASYYHVALVYSGLLVGIVMLVYIQVVLEENFEPATLIVWIIVA